jgi:NTE family protein
LPPTRLVGDPRIRYLQMLGAGRVDFRQHLAFAGESWPEGALKVCAVRASDFTRVVWDRDSGVALATAVAGSCSMPGYARAVPVDGHDYFDGGLWSPTNADVLVGEDLDLVVILSPMTPTGRPGPVVQRWADRRLAREIAVLEKAGSRVEVIRSPRTTARRAARWSSATGTTPGRHLGESFLGAGAQLSQLRSFLRS